MFKVKNKDGSDMLETHRNILAHEKVRHVGEPILAVIAETIDLAEEAADTIDIEFEELSNSTDINDALKTDAPIIREELNNNLCFDWELGSLNETSKELKSSNATFPPVTH